MNYNDSLAEEYRKFMKDVHLIGRGVKPAIADQFINLIEQYGIRWVGLQINNREYPCFAGVQLCEARNLDPSTFKKFVYERGSDSPTSQTPVITRLSGRGVELKGAAILKGEALRTFKREWKEMWGGESISSRSQSLLVCGWDVAFHFLTQGTNPLAQEFAALGAEAITNDVTEVVNSERPAVVSEAELQQMLIVASGYSEIKMVAETAYIQIDPDNPRQFTSRHVDLIERLPGHVIIYELKRDRITLQHIHETLVERRYLELVAAKYPSTKKFTITLIAPNGIDADAQDRLHQTYREFGNHGQSYRLTYVSFGSLLARLLNNAMKSRPALARWRLQRELKKESLINYLSTGERDALFNELTEDQLIIEHQKLGLTYVPREPALTGGNCRQTSKSSRDNTNLR